MVGNYHLWRADRTQNGGGVVANLRSGLEVIKLDYILRLKIKRND